MTGNHESRLKRACTLVTLYETPMSLRTGRTSVPAPWRLPSEDTQRCTWWDVTTSGRFVHKNDWACPRSVCYITQSQEIPCKDLTRWNDAHKKMQLKKGRLPDFERLIVAIQRDLGRCNNPSLKVTFGHAAMKTHAELHNSTLYSWQVWEQLSDVWVCERLRGWTLSVERSKRPRTVCVGEAKGTVCVCPQDVCSPMEPTWFRRAELLISTSGLSSKIFYISFSFLIFYFPRTGNDFSTS